MNGYELLVYVAAGIVTISGAGAIVVKAFVRAVRAVVEPKFDRLERSHDQFAALMDKQQSEQDEDFASGIRSLRERLEDLTSSVRWLEAEMRPNHGTSLRDAVDRLEQMLAQHVAAK